MPSPHDESNDRDPDTADGQLSTAPNSITVVWVGHGPRPQHEGYYMRGDQIIHRVQAFGVILEGPADQIRDELFGAGLELANGEEDMRREFAEEGRRRYEMGRQLGSRNLA